MKRVIALVLFGMLVCGWGALTLLFRWLARRGWISRRAGGATAGMFGEMQSLFGPGHRHTVEEIRHKQTTRDDSVAANDVDLDAGVVRIDCTGHTRSVAISPANRDE